MDLACGEGYGSFMLSEDADSVAAIDIDEETIRHASSKYIRENLQFIKGSITDIPTKAEKQFSIIVCFEALEHIEEHEKLLEEVKRLLMPDGLFIVSTPNKYLYSDAVNYVNPFHVKELYLDEFKTLLSVNFKNVLLYGQQLYPSSNIFPLYRESGPSRDFVIEKGDKEFVFVPSERKVARYFIALASDGGIDKKFVLGNSYLLDLSETLIHHKDARISNLEGVISQKDSRISELTGVLSERERELKGVDEAVRQ
ncbi:MAG: class I SAM-dependent methyltransferase, partial [Candidatus Hodarchaeota archaeon]